MNRHYQYLYLQRRALCIFSSLGSNHIKFMTYQMVQRKEFPPLLISVFIATTNIKITEVIP